MHTNTTNKSTKHKLDSSYFMLSGLDNARYFDSENANLKQYLKEVRQFKELTNEEEIKCINNYQHKGRNYKKDLELVTGYNQRFVIMIAKRYCPLTVDLCDIIGEANIGLMEAINKFDSSFGAKFITFAGRYIVKYIFEYLANLGFIQQPNRSKIHGVIDRISEELFNKNGYYPTIEELEDEFARRGIHVKDKSDFVKISIESMDAPVNSDDDSETTEYGEDDNIEERIDQSIIKENLAKAMKGLTDIERTVITRRFGLDGCEEDIDTISIEIGLSEYKIKQALDSAIKKLGRYKSMLK